MRGLFHSIFILLLKFSQGIQCSFLISWTLFISAQFWTKLNRWGRERVVIHLESLRKTFPIEPRKVLIPPPPSPILEVLASSPQLTNVANGLEGYFAGILKIFSNTPCLSIPHIYNIHLYRVFLYHLPVYLQKKSCIFGTSLCFRYDLTCTNSFTW